jgi:hypothetical protein
MKFEKLLMRVKRIALRIAQREIERILAKEGLPKDVKLEATDEGVTMTGRNLKARSVSDDAVRNIAR